MMEDGKTGYSNIPSTSVTNGMLEMDHLFDPRDNPTQPLTEFVRVQRRTPGERIDMATNSTFGLLTPVTLGMPTLKLFELPAPRSPGQPQYERRLVKFSGEVRGVSIHREDSDGTRLSKSIRFDRSTTPPRLVGVSLVIGHKDVVTDVDLHLDDYVLCGDYAVPRYVTQQLKNSTSPTIFVKQWKCLNLGITEPNPSDFAIVVDKDVKIRGLKTLPKVIDGKRTIDPFHIGDDLMYQGDYPVAQINDPNILEAQAKARASRSKGNYGWLFWLNIIGLAIIGWLMVRRQRSAGL